MIVNRSLLSVQYVNSTIRYTIGGVTTILLYTITKRTEVGCKPSTPLTKRTEAGVKRSTPLNKCTETGGKRSTPLNKHTEDACQQQSPSNKCTEDRRQRTEDRGRKANLVPKKLLPLGRCLKAEGDNKTARS